MMAGRFSVRQFVDEDVPQIRDIFARGMIGNFEPYPTIKAAVEKYVQECYNDDLFSAAKLKEVYGDQFWVVVDSRPEVDGASPNSEAAYIVGTVGLQRHNPTDCELRRMSVREAYRKLGIAKMLLEVLENYALKQTELKKIFLGTCSLFAPAITFYKNKGYQLSKTLPIPEFTEINACQEIYEKMINVI
eukprot:TRINITY_DN1152_c0_g1_i3.p1 TRINITY_DN1152_c0_g1~~TRINITY_DN1152_c0_g1_i3.p1  ORF type:complete len:189 (-),score=32.70 TRINITY_DN1152_c0_g1_i3:102-668(-)